MLCGGIFPYAGKREEEEQQHQSVFGFSGCGVADMVGLASIGDTCVWGGGGGGKTSGEEEEKPIPPHVTKAGKSIDRDVPHTPKIKEHEKKSRFRSTDLEKR